MGTTPSLTLNTGASIPATGLGTYRVRPEAASAIVSAALGQGYRLIDTAANYGNERGVGEGLRRSGLARSEVFVTTKLWLADYGHDAALRAFDRSLDRLGLDHVDLYLLHQPLPRSFAATIESYRAMESLFSEGRARAIGVSNFSAHHLDLLARECDVVPALNQVEVHPYFTQEDLRREHARRGILTQAWSPIGGINVYWHDAHRTAGSPLISPVVAAIADEVDRSPAQVVLRWQFQHGHCSIPKSVQVTRQAENLDLFGFELSADQMHRIDGLDTGIRGGPDPDGITE